METKKITARELVVILMAHELQGFTSCEFINYTSVTKPKLNKTHRITKEARPWAEVFKVCTANASLKVIYQNAVNNALVRAGEQEKGDNTFVAQELPWGQWVTYADGKRSKILIEKPESGKFYIRTTFNNPNEKPIVTYMDDKGNLLTKDQLAPYMAPERDEGPVVVRCIEVTGFRRIKLAGTEYEVI
jgi:hypothetical protein